MNKYDSNEGDYGYYTVNSSIYFNKIEAILAAEAIGTSPKFIFNDTSYDKLNWLVEPSETLEQLYAKRAWEIRNKYDYLILHYSGGWDSNNILETFVKNKSPLEEVYLRGPLTTANNDITDTRASNMFAEVYFNAYPIAQHVKETYYPDLVINVKDVTTGVLGYFSTENNANTFCSPSRRGANFSPSSLITRADSDILDPRHKQLVESGKRVGHILGVDKPMMFVENGEFKLRFLDKFLGMFFPGRASAVDLPVYQEPFYWAASTGPMIAKQAHAIKNYIKLHNINPNKMNDTRDRGFHDFIGNIIYQRQFTLNFNPDKFMTIAAVFPWDEFFFRDPAAEYLKNWKNSMDQLDQLVPAHWKHGGSIYNSLHGIFSKSYSIGI